MGLTSALFAGLTGMKANEFRMDVIGNNIANVNTYGYKAARADFQAQFSTTFSFGSAPSGAFGGTNPLQVGAGVTVGATRRNFAGGAPETTGMKTDLAIQGQGMFILDRPDGSRVYTRDGGFQINSENYLTSADGFFLQGYGIDTSFNVVEGTLGRIRLPMGEITTASPTSEAAFSGNITAMGDAADGAKGDIRGFLTSNVLFSASGGPGLVVGGVAGTGITSVYGGPSGTERLFEAGNIITVSQASKGGADLPTESFTVVGTEKLQDFIDWLEDVLGIFNRTDYPALPDLGAANEPGITITAAGEIQIVGNMGVKNELDINTTSIQVAKGTAATDPLVGSPFTFTPPANQAIVGESVRTSFRAYDSLGMSVDIDLTLVMAAKDDNGGIEWRYFAESSDNITSTGVIRALGTGTIKFDGNGNYMEGTSLTIPLQRVGTGAVTPQSITLDFSVLNSFDMISSVSLLSQDGFKAGTLADFSVSSDGVVTGSFTNGLNRSLGQVVLATFRNYEGLVAQDNNTYVTGPNSGDAIIKEPLDLGAGSITSAALELSNVDLSREFVNLIVSSTGFSASSRIIQTSDRLLSELMMMTR